VQTQLRGKVTYHCKVTRYRYLWSYVAHHISACQCTCSRYMNTGKSSLHKVSSVSSFVELGSVISDTPQNPWCVSILAHGETTQHADPHAAPKTERVGCHTIPNIPYRNRLPSCRSFAASLGSSRGEFPQSGGAQTENLDQVQKKSHDNPLTVATTCKTLWSTNICHNLSYTIYTTHKSRQNMSGVPLAAQS
jgi:hypothetical protein